MPKEEKRKIQHLVRCCIFAKKNIMTTVTINERTGKGKLLMEMLRKFENEGFVFIEKKPNQETEKAIGDVKKGKVTKCNSVDDMMKRLNS